MKKKSKAVAIFITFILANVAAIGIGIALFSKEQNKDALLAAILAMVIGCAITWGCESA
jgi:hypothetical protein